MKTENLPFLESVARQFSSLPIFVDFNKVRKHFEYILYAWMDAFQVCKCKSTADLACRTGVIFCVNRGEREARGEER